jgi:hypothetical protein
MKPLAAAVKHDLACLQFRSSPHLQRRGMRRKCHEDKVRHEMHVCGAWRVFLASQYPKIVEVGPGEAGFEFAASHNDGFNLRLAQARFVVVGLKERACTTSRHLFSCDNRN